MKSCPAISVILFYGGKSVEHEVSIESAKNIISVLGKEKEITLYPVFIDKDGRWHLTEEDLSKIKKISDIKYDFTKKVFITKDKTFKIDIAFSIIHGNGGEDGKLQGLFETMGVAYTGCDVLSSAVTMNKKLSKTIVKLNGIKVLDDVTFSANEFKKSRNEILKRIKKLGFPLFVKPNSLGSSVGVKKVKKKSEIISAIRNAFKYDRVVMVEKGLERPREIVCGVLGNEEKLDVSVCGEVIVKGRHEFYDYNAKYIDDKGMELKIPAEISKSAQNKIQQYTKKIFLALGCYGFSRADYFIDRRTNKIYFCEINTIPGFTSHSLFPSVFKASGLKLEEQIRRIIITALLRF
jgi:D-alanine-D-alanine ligase